MHMLYLLVIPTSKESGSYHEAEIVSVLLQVSFYPLIRRGKLEGNCRMKKKHTQNNNAFYSRQYSDSLGTLHLQLFHQKVSSGSVQPYNLPPTPCSAEVHSLCGWVRSNSGTDDISQQTIAMVHQGRQNDGNCNYSFICTKLSTDESHCVGET